MTSRENPAAYSRLRRAQTRDFSLGKSRHERQRRTDLGLAMLQAVALPGVCYTQDEIAAWAGTTNAAIYLIEARAMRKLKAKVIAGNDPILVELMEEFFNRRTPAKCITPNRRLTAI